MSVKRPTKSAGSSEFAPGVIAEAAPSEVVVLKIPGRLGEAQRGPLQGYDPQGGEEHQQPQRAERRDDRRLPELLDATAEAPDLVQQRVDLQAGDDCHQHGVFNVVADIA